MNLDTGRYYTMGHVTQFTGLTDRTIRNYIAQGFLTGEKINGLWHFTPEAVDQFVRHPAVRPSITARANSIVYDGLLGMGNKEDMCCMVLDIPNGDKKQIAEYFCYAISAGEYHNLRFSFDGVNQVPRVILRGPAQDILGLVGEYYRQK